MSDGSRDARDLLRRYLEQRRELGESELAMDGLSVEEALRLLGAGAGAMAPPSATADEAIGDWRSALAANGLAPGARAAAPAPLPRPAPEAPQPPVVQPPPTAPKEDRRMRFDAPADATAGDVPDGLVVGQEGTSELFDGPLAAATSLDDVARLVATCDRCALGARKISDVPGTGNPRAEFVVVGEAPGEEEDKRGEPFVGASGQLLTKILAAINLSREDVFICNVLKHRPPGNRNPTPDEVAACSPFLLRQLALLRPKVILAVGTFAAQTLLRTKEPIGKLRGRLHRYHGIPLVVTYHPAALLRNPTWKRPTWDDVQLARRILDRARPA